ncbi:unnamed protein product, partial [Ectocarpus sp. 12 AP-2014]
FTIWTTKFGHVSAEGRAEGAAVRVRQDRDAPPKYYTDVSSLELPASSCPGLQVLRLYESLGRLDGTAEDCLRTGEFLLACRTFVAGRDCKCGHAIEQPAPSLEQWAASHKHLERDANGDVIVCSACGHVDRAQKHDPDAIRELNCQLAFPGAKSTSEVDRLIGDIVRVGGGFSDHHISGHSIRRQNIKRVSLERSRDAAIEVAGHVDRTMVDVYFDPSEHQRRGGRHLSTDFVGQSGIEDAGYKDAGQALVSFASRDRLLQKDALAQGPRWGLHGFPRYSRLPRAVVDRIANGPVLREAEEKAAAKVQELANEMDELAGGSERTEKFGDVAFDKQGWATKVLAMADDAFADDPATLVKAKQLVERMERCKREVVNEGATLMRGVSKAIHHRLAQNASKSFDFTALSFVGELRRKHEATMKAERGVDLLIAGHIGTLIEDATASANKEKREKAQRAADAFKKKFTDLVKAEHKGRMKKAEHKNAEIEAENAKVERKEDKKPLVECGPPLYSPNDITLMAKPPCLLRTFWSAKNAVRRSGRGWVHALPRISKAPATGHSAGRRSGAAQYQRAEGTQRSETGVSTLAIYGVRKRVVECQEGGEDCKAVFLLTHRVDRTYRAHAQRAHGVAEEEAAADGYTDKFICPCKECGGRSELVGPRSIWQHLAAAEKPDPEESSRLEGAASLVDSLRRLTGIVNEVLSNRGGKALSPSAREKARLALSEHRESSTRAAGKLGIEVVDGGVVAPVVVSFAVKELTAAGMARRNKTHGARTAGNTGAARADGAGGTGKRKEVGGLEVVFACPRTCGAFAAKGFVVGSTFRSQHKEGCRPAVSASYPEGAGDSTIRCPVDPTCRMRYGSISNVSAQNFEKHMRTRHGGVVALLGTEKTPGRLAPLTYEQAIQLAGDWADKSKHRRSTGANSHETGSAWNDAKEVVFFSNQVSFGDKGEIVVEAGYTLDGSDSARLDAGGGQAKARAAGAASTLTQGQAAAARRRGEDMAAANARKVAAQRVANNSKKKKMTVGSGSGSGSGGGDSAGAGAGVSASVSGSGSSNKGKRKAAGKSSRPAVPVSRAAAAAGTGGGASSAPSRVGGSRVNGGGGSSGRGGAGRGSRTAAPAGR